MSLQQHIGAVCLMASATLAQAADPFAPLAEETRPMNTRWQTDYSGSLQLGLGYTSSDNFMFGQYNGLNDKGINLIGDLQWNSFRSGDSYWQVSASDLGLDTREGKITWGMTDRIRVTMAFDSQLQVRNNSGGTPFLGSSELRLPNDWVSGNYTGDWTGLDSSLHSLDRELERNIYTLGVSARLNDNWQLHSSLRYEDKQGTTDTGAAIYIDAASGDAALLPTPVDYYTTEFDVGLLYSGQRLHLDGSLAYSDFNNRDNLLRWQNPYSAFGPRVSYPEGEGGLGTAPDNTQSSARLSGQYLISTTTRIQFDGSYFVTGQDQSFEDYSINPQLLVSEPLPRDNFDGEVATSTFNAKLLMRPLAKLGLEATYKLRDRDYDTPRDGYRYIRGDGGDQPRSALTVYNTAHDYLSQAAGLELNYRLPLHSKLSLEYQYESIERKNASVEETEEDRYTLGYRIRPWSNFSAKLELSYADRAADTYHWDQAYYALLDTELINATPDSQRYLNHPQMSQFYLSNRERTEGKIDLNYMPDPFWNLNLNWLLRDDDFDKSDLGLTSSRGQGLYFNVGYTALTDFSLNFYAGYDNYNSDQGSRAFRGGQEKNAFEVVAPLPQASDPDRNWDMESNDTSVTLGANIAWQFSRELELSLDYSFVDTNSEQDFTTFGTSGLNADDLPDVETRLHHIQASGIWQLREALSIQLDYQYYRYSSDDWAWQDVQADTLGKVLTFGERNPNEQIHYVGTSVIYRWK